MYERKTSFNNELAEDRMSLIIWLEEEWDSFPLRISLIKIPKSPSKIELCRSNSKRKSIDLLAVRVSKITTEDGMEIISNKAVITSPWELRFQLTSIRRLPYRLTWSRTSRFSLAFNQLNVMKKTKKFSYLSKLLSKSIVRAPSILPLMLASKALN